MDQSYLEFVFITTVTSSDHLLMEAGFNSEFALAELEPSATNKLTRRAGMSTFYKSGRGKRPRQ